MLVFLIIFHTSVTHRNTIVLQLLDHRHFQFVNDNIVRVISTRCIPVWNEAKYLLCESSLCSTVDQTSKYFFDHREIIHTL